MNQPELILRTLDRHLVHPTRMILYGRAALALGYPEPYPEFQTTLDVDAILPEIEMRSIEEDDAFWDALERTNTELEPAGLYITHLFAESQVILTPTWLGRITPVPLPGLRFLSAFRPSTEDLILTKMMRVDPQDRDDIRFLLTRIEPNPHTIRQLLSLARIPPIPEIQEAFRANSEWLVAQLQ